MIYKKYGGYNTKTKKLSHIYESSLQVEMCYSQGRDTKDLKIVELEVKIINQKLKLKILLGMFMLFLMQICIWELLKFACNN